MALTPGTTLVGRYLISAPNRYWRHGRSVQGPTDSVIGWDVAIKVLPDSGDSALRGRFLREARTTAVLRHRNILPVLDVGADEGLTYYVTPYIAGGSLADLLKKKRKGQQRHRPRGHVLVGCAIEAEHRAIRLDAGQREQIRQLLAEVDRMKARVALTNGIEEVDER